jgi:hypothetical protein
MLVIRTPHAHSSVRFPTNQGTLLLPRPWGRTTGYGDGGEEAEFVSFARPTWPACVREPEALNLPSPTREEG